MTTTELDRLRAGGPNRIIVAIVGPWHGKPNESEVRLAAGSHVVVRDEFIETITEGSQS